VCVKTETKGAAKNWFAWAVKNKGAAFRTYMQQVFFANISSSKLEVLEDV